MARLKGDEYTQSTVQTMRQEIERNFEDRFYDPNRGCIVDSNVGGGRSESVSEHANLAAIRWELVDEPTVETIIDGLIHSIDATYKST